MREDETEKISLERVGTVINGKWTVDQLIGVGGMASVYAATHRNSKRAALKIMHPELSAQATIRERFLREGYLSNMVDHPGVVSIDDDVNRTRRPHTATLDRARFEDARDVDLGGL